MKMRQITILITLFFLLHSVQELYSQPPAKKDGLNVIDYYYLLTFEKVDSDSGLAIKDLENGVLVFSSDKGEREVSLFRKDDGTPILVVIGSRCDKTCKDSIEAFEPGFVDSKPVGMDRVTNDVLPRLSNRENRKIFKSKRVDNGEEPLGIHIDYRTSNFQNAIDYRTSNIPNTIEIFGGAAGEKYLKLYEMRLINDKFVIVR